MNFIKGKCPKCHGELQIPENREKIICMYCGEDIFTSEAIAEKSDSVAAVVKKDREKHPEYAAKAIQMFPQMLLSLEDPLNDFNKTIYESRFRDYEGQQWKTMEAIEDAFLTSDEPGQFLELLVGELITKVKEQMALMKHKRKQEDALTNYNMCLVVYVNPALMDYNKASGKPLVEEVLKQWKKNFPKTNLKPAAFEDINSGFNRRFCYITTAVCESLGKPDDCYELNILREYRDGYLQQTKDGEQLIKKYYDIAPTIVKHINKSQDKHRIYEKIWKNYLSPCIAFIEENENEKCKILYQDMVNTLNRKYFN